MAAAAGSGRGRTELMRVRTQLHELVSSDPALPSRPHGALVEELGDPGLGARTKALVRMAALVALGSSAACYRPIVAGAMNSGATDEQVIATMNAVAPIVGLARLVSATPHVALRVGYDIDAALEQLDPPWSSLPADPV